MLASTETFALFMHLVGAFVFVGGAMVAGIGFEAARTRAQPGEIALLLELTRAGVLCVAAGGLVLLPFGLWLVDLEHAGYARGWIVAAVGLFSVAVVLGALGGRRPRRARVLAGRLARESQDTTRELRALLDDRSSRAANYLSSLLVLAIVALMVFKP
jgi:hypothetical protein